MLRAVDPTLRLTLDLATETTMLEKMFSERRQEWVPVVYPPLDDGESPRSSVEELLTEQVRMAGGVYLIRDGETVVYVGQTGHWVAKRLREHRGAGTAGLIMESAYSEWTVTVQDSQFFSAVELERRLIAYYEPRFNRECDGLRSPLHLRACERYLSFYAYLVERIPDGWLRPKV